jgi:molybdenum cofactor cytidylyltransferase
MTAQQAPGGGTCQGTRHRNRGKARGGMFPQETKRSGTNTAGVLLAAGASTRMGKPKQLLPVKGEPMLSAVLREVLASDLERVVLVLGHRAAEIRRTLGRTLRHPRLSVIENPSYPEGISSSIRAGLHEIRNGYDHVMMLLADMPFLDTGRINGLLHGCLKSESPLGAVAVAGRRSHPVMFSRELYDELENLRGDAGARSLFRKYADRVCLVASGEGYDDRDIDTPEEYAAIEKNAKNIE